MITNERQLAITREEAAKFEEALAHVDEQTADLHPLLQKAMRESLESELDILRSDIAEFEGLRAGHRRVIEGDSLEDLPLALIGARVAAGLSQNALAQRLGLKEQQVQRYEATRYAGANLARLQAVATALGVTIHHRITLPTAAPPEPDPQSSVLSPQSSPSARAGASPSAPGTRGRRRAAAPRSTRGR